MTTETPLKLVSSYVSYVMCMVEMFCACLYGYCIYIYVAIDGQESVYSYEILLFFYVHDIFSNLHDLCGNV